MIKLLTGMVFLSAPRALPFYFPHYDSNEDGIIVFKEVLVSIKKVRDCMWCSFIILVILQRIVKQPGYETVIAGKEEN